MQTTTFAGATAGLAKFEGRWFDPDGTLIAVVSYGADSRFVLQLALPTEYVHLTGARLQNGEIAFTMTDGETYNCSLRLVEANEAEGICGCKGILLVRDPSPLWFVKPSARKATRLARQAYEGAFDWLARIL